jgi:FixJ family two-component response regulator
VKNKIKPSKLRHAHSDHPGITSCHVFLVDDDESIRLNLSITLRDAGFQVHTFENPNEFLQVDMSMSPAVILTDMVMPNMTGVELQAELNKRESIIPLILMSGKSSVTQSVLAMKQGAIEFLVKPFEKQALMDAIARGHDIHFRKTHMKTMLAKLSPRENQVFDLLVAGHDNAGLVEALGLSLPTAKQYKSEVVRKLGAKSLVDLIRLIV